MPRRNPTLQNTEQNTLDARAQAVLAAVIKEHLVTGDAVGSLVLADRFSGSAGWSSATIRNVMAELEEAGLVEQPHTSAGRVPTDQGYRYYVDNILEEARLSRADLRAIDKVFTSSGVDSATSSDRIMEKMSHALSELSDECRHRDFAVARRKPFESHRICSAFRQTNSGCVGNDLKHHSQQDHPAGR